MRQIEIVSRVTLLFLSIKFQVNPLTYLSLKKKKNVTIGKIISTLMKEQTFP